VNKQEFSASSWRSNQGLVIFMGVKLGSLRQSNAQYCCLLEYDFVYLAQTFRIKLLLPFSELSSNSCKWCPSQMAVDPDLGDLGHNILQYQVKTKAEFSRE